MNSFLTPDIAPGHTLTYPDLRASGATRAGVRSALAGGLLVRARRNVYLDASAPQAVREAQRVGGRLDCVSAVAGAGIFVLDKSGLHVQVEPERSRLRSPHSRRTRLSGARGVVVHWRACDAGTLHTVPLVEALAAAVRCQPPRAAIATLDNALFTGAIDEEGLAEVFSRLPAKYRVLRPLVDARAEAGSETIARLLLRAQGFDVQVQVQIDGVGRVDLVVDDGIVVECDSRAHHGGWEAQERDRLRDLRLAERGFVVLRPSARLIFTEPQILARAVAGLRRHPAPRR